MDGRLMHSAYYQAAPKELDLQNQEIEQLLPKTVCNYFANGVDLIHFFVLNERNALLYIDYWKVRAKIIRSSYILRQMHDCTNFFRNGITHFTKIRYQQLL